MKCTVQVTVTDDTGEIEQAVANAILIAKLPTMDESVHRGIFLEQLENIVRAMVDNQIGPLYDAVSAQIKEEEAAREQEAEEAAEEEAESQSDSKPKGKKHKQQEEE